jgi:FtsP/CotA-like multicopper oxidase with cupredoxin domain
MSIRINQPVISVIAIDGQPVNPFDLSNGIITLAPGQRSDLIIDMTSEPNHISLIELLVKNRPYPIAVFKYDEQIKREKLLDSSISLPLNPVNRIELPNSFEHIPLYIEGGAMGSMSAARYKGQDMSVRELIKYNQIWAFNGVAGLSDSPSFKVKRGTAISLDIENDNRWPHAFHVHGHHFKEDSNPDVWRDTTLVQRQQKTSLKFIADNPGKWLIHCHMIEHQAGGMVTWFEVV